jgi:alpha-tubulin suppressor-like RCC1 family protein
VGSNEFGQIGNGAGGVGAPDVTDPAQGVVINLTDVVAIAAGNFHTCALQVIGSVRCWGDNVVGQLGNDFDGSFQPAPVRVQGLTDVVAIAAGLGHVCAVRIGGTVHCWGDNFLGQVGSQNDFFVGTPFQLSDITNAVGIAAGREHSCALLVNGRAKCWGRNDEGQLGNNEVSFPLPFSPNPTPDDVENLSDAVALAGGGRLGFLGQSSDDFTCARRAGGTVRCWGDNDFGQLGDNSTTDHLQPETSVVRKTVPLQLGGGTFTLFPPLDRVSAITAGNLFGCALLASGQPFCWGSGSLFALPVSSFTFNIDPDVTLMGHNRVAHVTVLANCPEDQQVHVEVQLTQGGVFGQGHAVGDCTGGLTEYPVTVPAHGPTGFEPGPAEAQADAVIHDRGRTVDTQEWTRQVNLVFEP